MALLALPAAAASDGYAVLLDWQEGHTLVGTTVLLTSPLAPRFPFEVDACHRHILVDLLYEPAEANVTAEGFGEAELSYEFLVELWRADALVSTQRVRTSGYGYPMGLTSAPGAHELRVSLANGADVSWDLRVRGRAVVGELACLPRVVVNEVEADPAGPDAGKEWVELYNADPEETADLSLWTLRSTHGVTQSLTLPSGTTLAPGARLVIVFSAGQFLDNEDESVELLDAFGQLRDATPVASDQQNDARTWQRSPDGGQTWVFENGTPP